MNNQNNSNEPIILGTLKKEKSSKPVFVIFVFILLIGTCVGLPYIKDYLLREDNEITRFYYSYIGPLIGDTKEVYTNPVNEKKENNELPKVAYERLSENTVLKADNIEISKITVQNKTISYHVSSNEELNLNTEKYYILIYNNDKELLGESKVTGYSNSEGIDTTNNLSFNPKEGRLYVELRKINEENYPIVSKKDSLVCTNSQNEYKYVFDENNLSSIEHTFIYKSADVNEYVSLFDTYHKRSEIINLIENCSAQTVENDEGFIYNSTIFLNNMKTTDLGENIDYNYYDLETKYYVILFEMNAKGFDCQ